MNWNRSIRQVHRWLSLVFTAAVIANFMVMGQESIALWVGLLTLVPLALLLFTGLYLFVLPHASQWRGHRRSTDVRPETAAFPSE